MVGEDQAPGGVPAPGLHSSLEGPKAPLGELSGVLRLQPLEELLGGPIEKGITEKHYLSPLTVDDGR